MTPLPPASHLKLFSGSDDEPASPNRSLFPPSPDDPTLSPDSTLSQVFELHYRPVCLAFKSEATIKDIRQNLREWRRLTADPPVRRLSAAILSKFLEDLKASGLTYATVDKYRRHLQPIVNCTGPVTSRKKDRNNLGLVAIPPWFPDVPVPQEYCRKPRPTEEQLRAIWLACASMRSPKIPGVEPAFWWRTLIATYFELAFRRREAIQIRYDWLDRQANATYLVVRAEARKKGLRGIPKRLSRELAGAYEAMRTNGRSLIFEYPYSLRTLSTQYNRLLARAGVPVGQNLAFHALRRLHTDYLGAATAKLSLGHTSDVLVLESYKRAETVADEVAEKAPSLWAWLDVSANEAG